MEDREPYITGGNVRDKFLTEAMGDCWHEIEKKKIFTGGPKSGLSSWVDQCNKCKKETSYMPDFTTWDGFGKLWSFSIEQDWWTQFLSEQSGESVCFEISYHLINPDKFADDVYKFLLK